MGKVVTERERSGSRHALKEDKGFHGRVRARDYEDEHDRLDQLPRTEATMARHRNDYKSFSDVLGPLHGYLLKNCNRPWNKVKAEMQKHVGKKSVSHIHVWSHVDQYVCEDIVEGKDGKLYERRVGWRRLGGGKHGLFPLDHTNHYVEMFVDPRTGLLRKHKWYRVRGYSRGEKKEKPKTYIPLEDGVALEKIKGIWYRCGMATFYAKLTQADPATGCMPKDYSHSEENGAWRMSLAPGNRWRPPVPRTVYFYRRQKKALNRKELKAAGLENDRPEI